MLLSITMDSCWIKIKFKKIQCNWENGIETCEMSCMKRDASPGSMHDAGWKQTNKKKSQSLCFKTKETKPKYLNKNCAIILVLSGMNH